MKLFAAEASYAANRSRSCSSLRLFKRLSSALLHCRQSAHLLPVPHKALGLWDGNHFFVSYHSWRADAPDFAMLPSLTEANDLITSHMTRDSRLRPDAPFLAHTIAIPFSSSALNQCSLLPPTRPTPLRNASLCPTILPMRALKSSSPSLS